jgi:diguanylate cyclase (GGDEF)-like protein/PAS domain S-box-containing protein
VLAEACELAYPRPMDKEKDTGTNQRLEQRQLEYQAILENAPVGILVSRDRKVLRCTPRFSEIFGWPHGELIGQPGEVLYLNQADYEALGREAGPLLARGELLDVERPMRHKEGRPLQCHLRARAVNPQNTAEGTIWIVEDVTERHRDREQLQELLQRQQAILENAPVGILFTRDGLIVQCNPRMELILGWPSGMLKGQSARVFFEDDAEYARFGASVGPRLGAGELVDVEWHNTRHDGSKVWCRHLARALPTHDGNRSTIWITQNITGQKDAQAELQEARQQLEQRVEERTLELAFMNNQLQNEIADRVEIEKHLRMEEARFRDLSELSSDWFWEMDADLRFTEMSGGLFRTKLNPNRTLGKFRWELPIVGVSPEQWAEHRATLQARQPFRDFVYQMETEPGDLHWFSIAGKPVFEEGVFKGYRGTGADITDRRRAEQKIEFLAYHDPLTGLPNRVLLQDRLQQAIAHAERSRTSVALVFMDLDNFKKVNDSLGHAAGDALLGEVARRLRACVRESDTISRQGGDEFVLILGELHGGEGSLPVLTKVMEALQEPYLHEGNELSTSASIGISLYPEDGSDFEALSKKADMAMYRAKEAGRNTYRFFDEAMDQEALEHLLMRSGLRRALERGEFILYYQPQLEIASGRVIGVESLLRWRHPEFGLVAPGRFIPVAEESGLIVPIGAWVIQEACRQGAAWRQSGLADLTVAVNLSAAQFRREGIEETVTRALNDSGLPAQWLELELTESILIQDAEQVLASVRRLKQLGVKLSIDDFGTGYSSLSYLKRFDIDKLKIDQSFIRDLASDPDDAAIVRAVIQMSHSLGLRTIAEGVETPEMVQQLQAFGCDEAQGYHYARPMPAAEMERYLAGLQSPAP